MSMTQSIKVDGDTTSFNRNIARTAEYTNKAFKAVGKELGERITSAFTVAAIIDKVLDFSRSIIEAADNVGDLSDNLELSVEEVQKLGVAAQLAGTKFSRVERVMRTIQALRDQALAGDEKARKTFETLGISPSGMSPLEIIRQMIAAADRSKAAEGIVADTFKANLTTIKNVIDKLSNIGSVSIFSESDVAKIGEAKDKFDEMTRVLKVVFAPALVRIMTVFTNMMLGAVSIISEVSRLARGDFSLFSGKDKGRLFSLFKGIVNVKTSGVAGSTIPELFGMGDQSGTRDTSRDVPGLPTTTAEALKPTPAALGIKADTLSRIGLFVGGSGVGDRLVTIGSYQLTQLRGIREEMRKLNEG